MSTQREQSIKQNELLTVKEVAEYYRISRVTAWRWCQQGVIPAFQIGRSWRIRSEDLLQMEDCLKTGQDLLHAQLQAEQ